MTLEVFGARMGSSDPDRLDVTRKSAGPDGLLFAPSWQILRPALDARRQADALVKRALETLKLPLDHAERQDEFGLGNDADRLLEVAWEAYVPAYLAEMRASYRAQRAAWNALLARPRVVLLCYCTNYERCHRTILRTRILTSLGALDRGEILDAGQRTHGSARMPSR